MKSLKAVPALHGSEELSPAGMQAETKQNNLGNQL